MLRLSHLYFTHTLHVTEGREGARHRGRPFTCNHILSVWGQCTLTILIIFNGTIQGHLAHSQPLCYHHQYLIPSQKNPTIKQSLPLPLPQLLAPTHLLPVSKDLPVLDTSHEWNQTPCGFLCLLLSLSVMFLRLVHVAPVGAPPPFRAEQCSAAWPGHTVCSSAHQLSNARLVSTFG